MAENQLIVEPRQGTGKGLARKLRASGRIPAIFYGGGAAVTPLVLDPRILDRALRTSASGQNTIFDLQGGGLDGKLALVKELQRDPVKGSILHADLYAIDVDRTVEVSIPIHLSGTAVGVSLEGGILDHALRELEVECLPRAIPEELVLDVSGLGLGDSAHVRDIPLPEGVTLLSDPELPVVSVVAPAKVEAEEAAPSEEVAEPAEGAEGAEPKAEAEGAKESSD